MRTAGVISLAIVAAALFAAGQARLDAQPAVDPALRIGATDLGGVVTGANGPEAGVWVIAETTELPTKFAKIVVTDDRGRYVLPELPKRATACGCAATGSSTRRKFARRRARS